MGQIVDELRSKGPTEDEFQRARAYAAGRRVLAFENTNAVARYAANQKVVFDEDIDPDAAIRLLDEVAYDDVVAAAKTVDPDDLAVACVGPHSPDEF
jgi:predicted Zn-dependent peptidase